MRDNSADPETQESKEKKPFLQRGKGVGGGKGANGKC